MIDKEKIREGTVLILQGIGADLTDPNFVGTPDRVARMYEEIVEGVDKTEEEKKAILGAVFPEKHDEIVLVKDIRVYSVCPHHLCPVVLDCSLAYIPKGKVLGLSKLARVAEVFAKQPVLQERFTEDVADFLMKHLKPKGVAFVVEGVHYCMKMRGVKQKDAKTIAEQLISSIVKST